MRQAKFKVIDSRSNGTYLLCVRMRDTITSQRLEVEVEVENYLDRHSIGDILLIEYNEYDRTSGITEGRVIASEPNMESSQEHWLRTHREEWSILPRINSEIVNWKPKQQPTEEKEMQNHLVELLAKNFYTIGINFEHSTKSYTYKVSLGTELEVEDKVIVDTTSGLTIVNVNRVDEDTSGIDLSLDVKYKFIVQKLDTTEYDELCEKDKAIGKVIAQGAAEKARRELVESYTGDLNEEQIKALEDCGVTSVKRLE